MIDSNIKSVGLLTSGGDAPGMNAAIRAITRAGIYNGIRMYGIYRGYKGLISNEIEEFKTNSVSNIIQQGGTILKTARSMEFMTVEGRRIAYENMQKHGIEALIVIGGDGSLTGAGIFANEYNIPVVGLPATIDNDLNGTDTTIGYDTALNTIMQAMDKIRDTATSHERLFFVEVMGRNCGYLALNSAIVSGAEAAIIPEISIEKDQLGELIEQGFRKSKSSSMVLVTESEVTGGAMKLAERVKKEYPQYDVRVSILGHLQRGGSPTAQDRILASRMGIAAIQALQENQRNVMIGIRENEIDYVPFKKAIKKDREISEELLEVLRISSI
ncbi:MAG: 6-phosphofructokinase [Proteiniphilum sp.]|nr:6-phosphofructokinase [Proteiniphilum sp.]